MSKNNIDKIIKDKLERLEFEYDPLSWEQLEQKMELDSVGIPEENEQAVDSVVFDKLHQYEVSYDPNSWNLLATKLEIEQGLTRTIYRYKVMEMALMFLLIVTLFQYFPTKSEVLQQGPVAVLDSTDEQNAANQHDEITAEVSPANAAMEDLNENTSDQVENASIEQSSSSNQTIQNTVAVNTAEALTSNSTNLNTTKKVIASTSSESKDKVFLQSFPLLPTLKYSLQQSETVVNAYDLRGLQLKSLPSTSLDEVAFGPIASLEKTAFQSTFY